MNFSGIFKQKAGESNLDRCWRVYTVIRGSSHTRFAKTLLYIGFFSLAPPYFIQLLVYIFEISIPDKFLVAEPWLKGVGYFCIIAGILIYVLFEYLERKHKIRVEKNLPLLNPTNKPTLSLSALKYSARGVTNFSGREIELSKLEKFLECDDKVSWWVLGGIGGGGKSRLALEFCNKCIEQGWTAGFYDHHLSASLLSQWMPCQPHFIVVDYAAKDEEQVRALLKYAIQLDKQDKLRFSVRILLVERDAQGTIDFIEQTSTVGPELKDYIFDDTPLQLPSLKPEEIKPVVHDLCKFFKVPKAKRTSVLDYVLQSPSEKKLLVAGLYALNIALIHEPDSKITFKKLINDLIKHERETYWKKFNIVGDKEDYLLVATMADGIYLTDTKDYGIEAKAFIENFDFAESYSKVVGETVTKKLTPLSHDVVSELYVLNSFSPEKDRIKFHQLMKICFQMGAYQGFISFFTRAANDWRGHPSLRMLLPRFGQTEVELSAWLVLMSNIIDKIDIPLVKKVEMFNHVFHGVGQESPQIAYNLYSIFEGLFLRLLREASSTDTLNPWVREYGIITSDTVELSDANQPLPDGGHLNSVSSIVEIAPNLKVKPLDYCDAVIIAFTRVDKDCEKLFIWHGLFEVYHHKALHLVVNRESDLEKLRLLLSEIIDTFDGRWNLNWIFRDILAGLVQFGHHHKNKQQTVEIADYLLEVSLSRENSQNLDGLLMVISSLYGYTGQAYDKRKILALLWNDRFSKEIYSSETIGSEFLGFAVQLMSGFGDRVDAEFALSQLERVEKVVNHFPSQRNIESASMSLLQLTRREKELLSNEEVDLIYQRSVEFTKINGEIAPKIVENLIRQSITLYSNTLRNEHDSSNNYFYDVIDICQYFMNKNLGEQRLYVGGMLAEALRYALETKNKGFLCKLCDITNKLLNISSVDVTHFWPEFNTIYSEYMKLVNNGGTKKQAKIFADVAEYWIDNLSDNKNIYSVFSYLVNDYKQRF